MAVSDTDVFVALLEMTAGMLCTTLALGSAAVVGRGPRRLAALNRLLSAFYSCRLASSRYMRTVKNDARLYGKIAKIKQLWL